MNSEQNRETVKSKIPEGYRMIFEDTENKFVYLALKGSDLKEIARTELLEIIESGKPVPMLEIRKK